VNTQVGREVVGFFDLLGIDYSLSMRVIDRYFCVAVVSIVLHSRQEIIAFSFDRPLQNFSTQK